VWWGGCGGWGVGRQRKPGKIKVASDGGKTTKTKGTGEHKREGSRLGRAREAK